MRAVVVREFGPIRSHRLETWPDPEPGPAEVLIEIHAIGLNYPDALMLQGRYQKRPERPFVPGRDLAGVVRAVGERVTRCAVGDRVVAQVFSGAFAERVAAPETRCFPLPDGIDFADAAAMMTVFNTAWVAVELRGAVRRGEIVLVTGAAGGVGLAAIQLCKVRGATVLAAVSSPEKGALAVENGADHVVDSNAADAEELKAHLTRQVAAITGAPEGRGCDVVVENVGGAMFEACLRVLKFAGRQLIVGFAGGTIPAPRVHYLLYNNLTVMGAPLDIHFDHAYPEMERGVRETHRLYREGRIRANVTACLPLEQFKEAFDLITERRIRGKVILTVGR